MLFMLFVKKKPFHFFFICCFMLFSSFCFFLFLISRLLHLFSIRLTCFPFFFRSSFQFFIVSFSFFSFCHRFIFVLLCFPVSVSRLSQVQCMFCICFQCFLLFGISFFDTSNLLVPLPPFFFPCFLFDLWSWRFSTPRNPKSSKLWAFVSPFPVCRFFPSSLSCPMSLHHLLFAVSMFFKFRFFATFVIMLFLFCSCSCSFHSRFFCFFVF